MYNRLCLFYFVIDLQPVSVYQTPIDPTGPWTWLSQWLVDYAQDIGKFHNTRASLTAESLQTFRDCEAYAVQDYVEPEGGWNTFNEFFAREIKPGLRPIDHFDDDRVIVSPADSVFDGSWDIDENSCVDLKNVPWSISQLLEDTTQGDKFKGGKFCHSFLNTTDYHRQHAPVSGTVIEAKVVPGICYLEVEVQNDSRSGQPKLIMKRKLASGAGGSRSLNAPNIPGYQFLQARALILIDNPTLGLVAVLPIGMAQVSSVVLTIKEGETVTKGQELSYFQFGGSDCVMVFQKDANVTFTADIGTHYNFGKQVAVGSPPSH